MSQQKFDTDELTEELSENYEHVFNEFTHVMVDDVEDFSALFEQVAEVVGRHNFQIQIENRPDTAYIYPPMDDPEGEF